MPHSVKSHEDHRKSICFSSCSPISPHPLSKESRAKGRSRSISSPPSPVKLCLACLSVLQQGKAHVCTEGEYNKNLVSLASSTPKGGQMVAASVLKELPSSPGGTVCLTQVKEGAPLPVSVRKAKGDSSGPLFGVADAVEIQQYTQDFFKVSQVVIDGKDKVIIHCVDLSELVFFYS